MWLGNHAWLVCLWALRDYRDLAFRLTSPALMLLAREALFTVSKKRHAVSNRLQLRSTRELEQELSKVAVQRCETDVAGD